jgi:hypothetical protein
MVSRWQTTLNSISGLCGWFPINYEFLGLVRSELEEALRLIAPLNLPWVSPTLLDPLLHLLLCLPDQLLCLPQLLAPLPDQLLCLLQLLNPLPHLLDSLPQLLFCLPQLLDLSPDQYIQWQGIMG